MKALTTCTFSLIKGFHAQFVMGRRVSRLASLIAEHLPPQASILDIGAGSGEITAALSALRNDVTIQGIDVYVREHTAIPILPYDGETINFPDESFDCCLLIDVLHHSPHPARVLQEAARVSRKYVIVKDHCCENRHDAWVLRLMDWVGNAAHHVRSTYFYQSWAQWEMLFNESQLEPIFLNTRLELYPLLFTYLCDRQLHLLVNLSKKHGPYNER